MSSIVFQNQLGEGLIIRGDAYSRINRKNNDKKDCYTKKL